MRVQGACGRWDAADLRRGSVKEEYGDVWGMGHRYGVHLRVCVRGCKGCTGCWGVDTQRTLGGVGVFRGCKWCGGIGTQQA